MAEPSAGAIPGAGCTKTVLAGLSGTCTGEPNCLQVPSTTITAAQLGKCLASLGWLAGTYQLNLVGTTLVPEILVNGVCLCSRGTLLPAKGVVTVERAWTLDCWRHLEKQENLGKGVGGW